jgi:hypothetical protein
VGTRHFAADDDPLDYPDATPSTTAAATSDGVPPDARSLHSRQQALVGYAAEPDPVRFDAAMETPLCRNNVILLVWHESSRFAGADLGRTRARRRPSHEAEPQRQGIDQVTTVRKRSFISFS